MNIFKNKNNQDFQKKKKNILKRYLKQDKTEHHWPLAVC